MQLTPEINYLIETYAQAARRKKLGKQEDKIQVGKTISPLAVVYERLRNVIDYKKEHLIRRSAVERILKRLLWERPGNSAAVYIDILIRELTWAKYFKNSSITLKNSQAANQILEKYLAIISLAGSRDKLIEIASAEIEEALDPKLFYIQAFCDAFFSYFKGRLKWEDPLTDEQKDTYLYVAIHKGLLKSDAARIRYHLIKKIYPKWGGLTEIDLPTARGIIHDIDSLEEYINSPTQIKLYRVAKAQSANFQVLKELMESSEMESVLTDKDVLAGYVERICTERYEEIGQNIRRGIIRSIIYILITKMFVVLLIEIPYEIMVNHAISKLPITINLLTPVVLMLLISIAIKKPGANNTKKIIKNLNRFIYKGEKGREIVFSFQSSDKGTLSYKVFILFYVFLFVIVFGSTGYLLRKLHFNVASMGIFYMFLSLVLLFAFRVKATATELNVSGRREGAFSGILTNLSLPLLNLGVLLSKSLSKINFFILIMDFLIEAPFKAIIGVFAEWAYFIREKRADVLEVPTDS